MTAATLLLLLSPGARADTIHVPSTVTRLSDAVAWASQTSGPDVIVIDGSDSRWDPTIETYVSVYADVSIESASSGTQVELPGLKIYSGVSVSLTDVDIIGYYQIPSDSDYSGVIAAPRVLVSGATLSVTDSDLSYDSAHWAGTGFLSHDATTTFTDVTVNGYIDGYAGGYVVAEHDSASFSMTGGEVSENLGSGLALYGPDPFQGAATGVLDVSISGVSFIDNEGFAGGGAIDAWLVRTLDIQGVTFTGNTTYGYGSVLAAFDCAEVLISGSSVDGRRSDGQPNTPPDLAAGVFVSHYYGEGGRETPLLEISDTSFVDIEGDLDFTVGGAISTEFVEVVLSRVTAQDVAAESGAFLYMEGGHLDAEDLWVQGYEVGDGGGAFHLVEVESSVQTSDYGVRELTLCDGEQGRYDAAGLGFVVEESFITIENSVMMNNFSSTSPLVAVWGSEVALSHNSIVGNEVDLLIGAEDNDALWLDANIIDGNGHTAIGLEQSGDGDVFGLHNLWHGFTVEPWLAESAFEDEGELDSQIVDEDPLYLFPLSFVDCPGAAYVYFDSPAVDGDLEFEEEGLGREWDDTNPDIGAAGGLPYQSYDPTVDDSDGDGVEDRYDCDPDAPNSLIGVEIWYDGLDHNCDRLDDFDADTDGWRGGEYGEDCDDNDDRVHPNQAETWYNGVDDNCDELDDYDADGDGYGAAAYGEGDDCDDTNADVHPGAAEVWYNEVDEDCDENLHDADGDGAIWDGVSGGSDCDDSDPSVHPGAEDILDDDIDQDCFNGPASSLTDTVTLTGGCSSAPSPRRGGGWLVLGLGLLLARRRGAQVA